MRIMLALAALSAIGIVAQPQPTTLTPITFTLQGEQTQPVLWTVTDLATNEQAVTFDIRTIITIGPGAGAWEGKTYLTLSPYATALVVDGDVVMWRTRWVASSRAVHEDWRQP